MSGTRRTWAMRCVAITISFVCLNLGQALYPFNPGATDREYKRPPKAILDVLTAPLTPRASISPTGDVVLLYSAMVYPPIGIIDQPFVGLAGVRIDVTTSGPHNPTQFQNLILKQVRDGAEKPVSLPPGFSFSQPLWSPDGQRIAFTHSASASTELWIVDVNSGRAHAIRNVELNAVLGAPCEWLPDGNSLLCRTIPTDRREVPDSSMRSSGPRIEEDEGKGATPIYQDLLRDSHDADLFDYYAASQICVVNIARDKITELGPHAVFHSAKAAPDGKHILVEIVHRPYSEIVRENDFPRNIEVWNRTGQVIYRVASLPLEDSIPIGGVPSGPREVQWVPNEPATLTWVEALDKGNPKNEVPQRDKVMCFEAPFKNLPHEFARTENRFAGLYWGQEGDLALLLEFDRSRMRWRGWFVNPAKPEDKRLAWDLGVQDRYHQPGEPLMNTLPSGHQVMSESGKYIFFAGPGFSAEGACPFLDKMDIITLQATRAFRCDGKSYETVVGLLSADGATFLTRRETLANPPDYYVHGLNGAVRRFTNTNDPTPQLRAITKQIVKYKRADGVDLSMTVYLPPGYTRGERRPAVLWAYPTEFTDATLTGQTLDSPNRFTTITGPSELFFLLSGYVVLDDVSMPIVGSSETANDSFLDQIAADAKAAIDKATQMGVVDNDRVGVGGASYGAFMTANLLAHTQLFRAGIALSGAYDRTLTPFGFQHERRTLWQARETYLNVSPLIYADQIKSPLLLIHGAEDNNPGTLPIQSEMMYRAIRGNRGTVRLVLLPGEGHGYSARESVEHVLYEMMSWFDKYVKNAAGSSQSASSTNK